MHSGSGKSRPRKLSDNWVNSNSNVPVTSHEKTETDNDSMARPNGSLIASIHENKGLPQSNKALLKSEVGLGRVRSMNEGSPDISRLSALVTR